MLVDETGVKVMLDDGDDLESLCRKFCHVLYQLKRLRDKNKRKGGIELAGLVMETLERQFAEKAEKQYRIDKA